MWQREAIDLTALELEGHGLAPPSVALLLEEIGAHDRVDQIEEARQDAIIIETFDLLHFFGDRAARPGLHFASAGLNRIGIKAREEQSNERRGKLRVSRQRLRHVVLRVANCRLLKIAGQAPYQRCVAPGEAGHYYQRVKFVALAFAIAQRDQSLFEPRRQRLDVDLTATGETDRHIVKKDRLGAHGRNPKAGFVNDFEAEILEDRHPLRER